MDRPIPHDALAQVLRDHGRLVGSQPERVRGLLSDILGVDGRDFRAEVDALVVACEEGVPALLLDQADTAESADSAVTEGVGRLEARGLASERAADATLTWASALEAQVSDSLRTSLSSSVRSDPPPEAHTGGVLAADATVLPLAPAGGRPPEAAAPAPPVPRAAPGPSPTPPRSPAPTPPPDLSSTDLSTTDPLPASASRRTALKLPAGRRGPAVVALLVTALVASALGAKALWPEGTTTPDAAPAAATRGGTLRLTSSGGLTWDPMETTDPGLRLLMNRALYRGLVAFQAAANDQPATLVADLATDTGTTLDKGKTWSFDLRPGVRWEDGSPVTCADAKAGVARAFGAAKFFGYSYEAAVLIDVPQGADGLPVYQGKGAVGQAAFDRAVSCSGSTLTVRLSAPDYEFQRYLAVPELAPFRVAPAVGPGTRSLSNGPYAVDAATATATTVALVRNGRWSAATDTLRPAFPDRIEVTTAADDDVAQGLATDAVAYRRTMTLSPLPAAADSAFVSAPDRTQVAPAGVTELLVPNLRTTTMSSAANRRAFALSTDRASYVAAMGGPAARMEQRSTAGVYHNGPTVAFDVQQARSLLAGDTPRLKVAYRSSPELERAMTALAAGWKQAGFAVNLVAFKGDSAAYLTAMADAAATTTYDAWRGDYVDSLDRSWTAQRIDPRVSAGLPAADAQTVTSAIDSALGTPPGPARDAAWRNVDDVISVLALLVPLANRVSLVGSGSAVRGATTSLEFSGAIDPLRVSLASTDS